MRYYFNATSHFTAATPIYMMPELPFTITDISALEVKITERANKASFLYTPRPHDTPITHFYGSC